MKTLPKIVCPVCGQEYMPSEIFTAKYFLGHESHIEKLSSGKIDFTFGQISNTVETYICDNCDTKFEVELEGYWKVTEIKEKEIKEYKTQLQPKTLMDEGLFNDNNSREEE